MQEMLYSTVSMQVRLYSKHAGDPVLQAGRMSTVLFEKCAFPSVKTFCKARPQRRETTPTVSHNDAKPKYRYFKPKNCSVEDPDPGSAAFLTHGSGIRIRFFPDPGSRSWIPNPYFCELSDNFLGKKFYNSLKIGINIFSSAFQK
jgi:hypothetical protein